VQSREELIITALQERVGQLSANYELQIAMLRAELTALANEKEEREKAIADYSNLIESKVGESN
jgi:hypothetical protein